MMKKSIKKIIALLVILSSITATVVCIQASEQPDPNTSQNSTNGNYVLVDTGQNSYFDDIQTISRPQLGEPYYGQDAQYNGNQTSYQDNGDGTVTDLNTGLMWQQSLDHNNDGDIDIDDKLSYDEIITMVSEGVSFAGYNDWRLPTIKEQYSLILFSGIDISGYDGSSTEGLTPFIDTDTFEFAYGDTSANDRLIDVQCVSTTVYVAENQDLIFGVNFADGRIKGYGKTLFNQPKMFNYLLVRGLDYGTNSFVDNGDGTITDTATGLMWMKEDNGEGLLWEDALNYAEELDYAGYSDWRLPNAKELQSIVDYTRSPDTTDSAAINPIFNCSQITNEAGQTDYPFYWSSTTHECMMGEVEGAWAVYVSFGRAMGNMNGWIDVHGAGAQRSDPKSGDPEEYSDGHGPQGDAVRIYNYVRPVRKGISENQSPEKPETPTGPTSGESGMEYTYNTSTSDHEGEQVYYWFDWGDDINRGWLGPYDSGEEVTSSHTWDSKGSFQIKVKAKDTNGIQSEWSDPLPISMPKSDSIFSQIVQYFQEKPIATIVAGGISITLLFVIWKVLFNMR